MQICHRATKRHQLECPSDIMRLVQWFGVSSQHCLSTPIRHKVVFHITGENVVYSPPFSIPIIPLIHRLDIVIHYCRHPGIECWLILTKLTSPTPAGTAPLLRGLCSLPLLMKGAFTTRAALSARAFPSPLRGAGIAAAALKGRVRSSWRGRRIGSRGLMFD